MDIVIENAHENNLKHISTSVPLYCLTAITGVSGSGKSTLLRNILASYGAVDYTRIHTKTVMAALKISDYVKVDSVKNLPQTVYTNPRSSISNPFSTVSTVCGIHEIIRTMFEQFGETICPDCGRVQSKIISSDSVFVVDLIYDQYYAFARKMVEEAGEIKSEIFYNQKMKPLKNPGKSASFAELYFTLHRPSVSFIKRFNKDFNCTIMVDNDSPFNPLYFSLCPCKSIVPRLIRNRFSFSTDWDEGGGGCSHCNGYGTVVNFTKSRLIADPTRGILTGGLNFVSEKGIKYTCITEKFIQAAAKFYGIDLSLPIEQMNDAQLDLLFYGNNDTLTFQDRVGGKKNQLYKGIAGFLTESLQKGKGKSVLSDYSINTICSGCGGGRLDQRTNCFYLFGKRPCDLLSMTIQELNTWCQTINHDIDLTASVYLRRLERKTDYFCRLSCGHLGLGRSCRTLSGGELQRLRLCAALNSDTIGLCYLLDEPSSGLHPKDIGRLGNLLREISLYNTVIMVEHNKQMLQFCDYFVDLGPRGGKNGGQVLLSDYRGNLSGYNTATSQMLLSNTSEAEKLSAKIPVDFIEFRHLKYNNLKNISVKIPKNCFTTLCGVSGSGKSTLIRDVIYSQVKKNPGKFGFDQVHYLCQGDSARSSFSTVCSVLGLGEYIAKLFSKASRLKKNCFMLNSSEGKCLFCHGKGFHCSENDEPLGVCEHCNGQKFSSEVLKATVGGKNIFHLLNTPLDELAAFVQNSKLKYIFQVCSLLGIGYLTLARSCTSLSKGELQRARLATELSAGKKNQLYLLDEPSNGLHDSDCRKLIEAIQKISDLGNTVIAVEHSLRVIASSDYMIELGGTGAQGGYLLFNGEPSKLNNTPTSDAMRHKTMISEVMPSKLNLDVGCEMHFSNDSQTLSFAPHRVYEVAQNAEILMDAASKSEENYLAVAIPNNVFFSKVKHADVSLYSPILRLIDFTALIRYDISLYSALGIRELILSELGQRSEGSALDCYIWDEHSPTGKCPNCNGTGLTETVSRSFFIQGDRLTAGCIRFLNNSTIFKDVKTQLKKKAGIEFSVELSEMNERSFLALFYGSDYPVEINKKIVKWPGIINCFLQNHRYYPDTQAEEVYRSKMKVVCPVCSGTRLRSQFCNSSVWSITYERFLNLSLCDLRERLESDASDGIRKNSVLDTLALLQGMGLGNFHLGDRLSSLDCVSANLVKLVSLYKHPIFDAGIVISGMDQLKKPTQSVIRSLFSAWSKSNTIFIL